jgi:hypothetical protein
MSAAEWTTADHPATLLGLLRTVSPFLRTPTARRGLRRFACLCLRRVWRHLDEAARRTVEAAERYAEGRATRAELEEPQPVNHRGGAVASWAGFAARCATLADPLRAAEVVSATVVTLLRASLKNRPRDEIEAPVGEEKQHQCWALRELLGDPFRSVRVEAAWRRWNGGCVPRLARAIAESGGFDELPVLADALEEAGCGDAALLGHCRSTEGHVAGCWALGLLLGGAERVAVPRVA